MFPVGQRAIQRDHEINWVTVIYDTLAVEDHRQFAICYGVVKMEHTVYQSPSYIRVCAVGMRQGTDCQTDTQARVANTQYTLYISPGLYASRDM